MLLSILVTLLTFCCGCAALGADSVSVGQVTNGWLHRGVALRDDGPGFARMRPGESTRYGTPEMIALIEQVGAALASAFPGGSPLIVGDLSAPAGGRHSRHLSHRNGRDADLGFLAAPAAPDASLPTAFFAVDRFGLDGDAKPVVFDTPRNWLLVRTLLASHVARVQWIFCASSIKARLLAYAAQHESDHRILGRAVWMLHEPSGGDPHRDHFHVRIACSAQDEALGCLDGAPDWPWLHDAAGKGPVRAGPSGDDEALVGWVLSTSRR